MLLNRTRRWLTAEAPFMVVVAMVVAALIFLVFQAAHWRRGVGGIAAALFVGGILRLALPEHRAGLLAVRGRWRDGICYLLVGGVIIGAAIRLR